MQTVKTTVVLLICVVLLSACGLKGPLYLPDENPVSEPAAEQDSNEGTDAEDKENDSNGNGNKTPVSI
jgi:predicted small lipoprotein YifL